MSEILPPVGTASAEGLRERKRRETRQRIAETAQVLGRSEGAIKQLQLRAVRSLAKMLDAEAS